MLTHRVVPPCGQRCCSGRGSRPNKFAMPSKPGDTMNADTRAERANTLRATATRKESLGTTALEDALAYAKAFVASPELRRASNVKARERTRQAVVDAKRWWKVNWAAASLVEPPQVTRNREIRRRQMAEDGLYGPKEPSTLPVDDMRRYGFVIGQEGGYVQSNYNRVDGVPRMTNAHDHSFEALDDRWHAMFHGGQRTDGGATPGYAGPMASTVGPRPAPPRSPPQGEQPKWSFSNSPNRDGGNTPEQ
jgi:hypothetical protein